MDYKRLTQATKIAVLFFLGILTSCEQDTPKSSFTQKFPKHPISLVETLGDSLRLINPSGDTVTWKMFFDSKTQVSTITENAETLFTGWASRFRKRYYLSTEQKDKTYYYDAIEINQSKNQLRGFAGLQAMFQIDKLIDNQKIPKRMFPDKENYPYRLKPHRRAVHKIFNNILDEAANTFQLLQQLPQHPEIYETPDTLLQETQTDKNQNDADNQLVEKIFPNPTTGVVNIVLQEQGDYTLKVLNSTGVIVNTLAFSGTEKQVDLSGLPRGIYWLQITEKEGDSGSTARIVLE
ncbi:MAG: T9SS type A sorting domain-containing protein [Bacteroidia bacterium]|nr:T9SS type A sorting domain-containing protein [Bacteroidia bacterium]